jgi:flavin reductase (DIM6/NTAB) family NADH-FMN oxidoreductase RutF
MTHLLGPAAWRTDADPVSTSVDARSFCDFMSAFHTGVAVVTTVDTAGVSHGMTCTSLASVTLTPPTLLVCLNSASGTLRAVLDSRRFAVNILHQRAAGTAEFFGSTIPRGSSTSAQQQSPELAQPWLRDDSLAMAECDLTATQVVGSHTVVFGRVKRSEHCDDAPLIYGRRRYHQVLGPARW